MKQGWLLVSVIVVMGLMVGAARAADEPPGRAVMLDPQKIVQNARAAVTALDLSDDQKTKVAAIFDTADQQAKTLANQIANLAPRDKFTQVGSLLKDLHDRLAQVLSADQMQQVGAKLNLGRPGAAAMNLLQDALPKLDLSDDQKKQVADAMEQVRQSAAALRERAISGQDVSGDMQQIRDDMRQKLGDILTPDQRLKLRDLMQQNAPDLPATPPAAPAAKEAAKDPAKSDDKDDALSAVPGPDVGVAAPDIKLDIPAGHSVALSTFKGHVVVIELGSLSCPTFRDRAADVEKLKADVGLKAYFAVIYTREAHPAGDKQIDRNKKDQIDIPQPADIDARKALAARAEKTLHITLPMTVDDMDDSLVKALGGFPNGCIVIGKDGNVAGRQRWVEPVALKRMIDEANKDGK